MITDVEAINEIWSAVRPYIKSSERIHAADAFIEVLDEYGMLDVDIQMFEKELKIAAKTHLGEADDD